MFTTTRDPQATEHESTRHLVDQLANAEEARSEEELRGKWLYLALAWLYEHRLDDPDPLQRVEEIYAEEARSEEELRGKWLHLALACLYEHRLDDPDPLQRVEEIYADFGYPEGVAQFVRYMPMDGPDLGSREANERRLFERWKRYIDDAATLYERR